jgi:hypothetical protein
MKEDVLVDMRTKISILQWNFRKALDKIEKSRHFGSGTDGLLCPTVTGRHLLHYCPNWLLLIEIRTVNTGHATSELKWKYRPILDTLAIDSKYWSFECSLWLRYSPWHVNNTCITRMPTVNHAVFTFGSTHDDQYIVVTLPAMGW